MPMEDYKWLVYLVIGIVWYLIKNKAQKQSQPEDSRPDYQDTTSSTPSGKPVTFEDLLREIQATKAPAPPAPKPEVKPFYEAPVYPKYEDYDDNLEDEAKDLETIETDHRKNNDIYDVYEKAKQAAFQRPSLEETMKVEDTIVRFGQFKEYESHEEPSMADKIAKEFEDKEQVRKAFIMNEILTRKY